MRHPPILAIACLLPFATTALRAQDDLRDKVTRTDGTVLMGRVANPFHGDVIELRQGGKRVRVPRAEAAEVRTVHDELVDFFARRQRLVGNERGQWFLVDQAKSRGLPGIAELQAMAIALQGGEFAADAHRFLGHRETARGWLWPHDNQHLTLDKLHERLADKPLVLPGELFRVTIDSGLQPGIAAALDLEACGTWWLQTYGKPIELGAVLQPAQMRIWRNAEKFPRWGFMPRPLYMPDPFGDEGRTYYLLDGNRPEELFATGLHALLYRTLAPGHRAQTERDRLCAWIEIGLPQYCAACFGGPPGQAAAITPEPAGLLALQALAPEMRLSQLVHLPLYGSYYVTQDAATATNWAAARMFVQYLLEDPDKLELRDEFCALVRLAIRDGKGDSTTVFAQVLGRRPEEFEVAWRKWLDKVANGG